MSPTIELTHKGMMLTNTRITIIPTADQNGNVMATITFKNVLGEAVNHRLAVAEPLLGMAINTVKRTIVIARI